MQKPSKNQIKAAEQRLSDARQTLADREKALQGAEAGIEAARRNWEAGNEEPPAIRLVELKADTVRLTPLVKAARAAIAEAQRDLNTITPALAETVARALGDHLGVTAEVGYGVPTTAPKEPKVYVVEAPGRESDQVTGALSGDLTIVATGPDAAAMDITDLTEHLAGRQVKTTASPPQEEVHQGIHTVGLHVTSALPANAVIPEIADNEIGRVCNYQLAQSLVNRTRDQWGNPTVTASGQSEKIGEAADGGSRRLEVEATLTAQQVRGTRWDRTRTRQATEAVLTEHFAIGTGFPGLGTVERVTVETTTGVNPPPIEGLGKDWALEFASATARVVFVSKTAD